MGSHIQLIGSIVIGMLLLMGILNLNSTLTMESIVQLEDNIVQMNTSSIASVIDFDFRKMGYKVPNTSAIISSYSSNSIQFLADLNGDNNVETISYSVSNCEAVSSTANPNDRYLYRQINNGNLEILAAGVTKFNLKYYDRTGNTAANINAIACIEIQLEVESFRPYIDDLGRYALNVWQTKISPPNLIY